MTDLTKSLEQCGFSPGEREAAESIAQPEGLIGVSLPSDYCQFLLTVGSGYLDAWADCTVPTPFGRQHGMTTLHSVAEVIDLLDSTITPRNMICIGYGHFGATTCLSIAGLDHGQVFSLDTEMRFYWGESEIARYPHLAPEIREFFRMRDADELPSRPWATTTAIMSLTHFANSSQRFIQMNRRPNSHTSRRCPQLW